MELWDLYDINKNLTGKTMIRGEPIPQGSFHLVVHVWITDGNGRFLISQRSKSRAKHPLLWECVGGSVLLGEDSLTAAMRETIEEVGISLSPDQGKILFSKVREEVNGAIFRDIVDVWLFRYNGDITLENATTDEVEQAHWLSLDEIKALWNNGDFVPTLGYFFTDVYGK